MTRRATRKAPALPARAKKQCFALTVEGQPMLVEYTPNSMDGEFAAGAVDADGDRVHRQREDRKSSTKYKDDGEEDGPGHTAKKVAPTAKEVGHRSGDELAHCVRHGARRGDEAQAAFAIRICELRCRRARVAVGDGDKRSDFPRNEGRDIVGQKNFVAVPERLGVERHKFDIADLNASLAPESGQWRYIRLD